MSRQVITLLLVLTAGLGLILFFSLKKSEINSVPPAQFVDSSPSQDQTFYRSPINVVVNFNQDLTDRSTVSVFHQGTDVTTQKAEISENKLTLRRPLRSGLTSGTYLTKYVACFQNNDCSEGQFTFTIDEKSGADYQDLRGQKEVTIKMNHLSFDQPRIIITTGTKVTWVNEEEVDHFINTDPHPSHTFFPDQNSLEIKRDGNYAVTFVDPGEYPYHCSAHVPEGMVGRVVVQ
jgi:plastocyanin